jgi:hypothetical protein
VRVDEEVGRLDEAVEAVGGGLGVAGGAEGGEGEAVVRGGGAGGGGGGGVGGAVGGADGEGAVPGKGGWLVWDGMGGWREGGTTGERRSGCSLRGFCATTWYRIGGGDGREGVVDGMVNLHHFRLGLWDGGPVGCLGVVVFVPSLWSERFRTVYRLRKRQGESALLLEGGGSKG